MLFINTRPPERAQALTQCLAQAHYTVLELPVLALKAKALDATLKNLYQQLYQAQVIVVVSPKAVQIGMQYLQQLNIDLSQLDHIQWIAVGNMTAYALSQYGIKCHIPEVETSEGMLSLPIFNDVQDLKKIAFWRGEGGRQFMMQQCREHDIEVFNFVLYERYCPEKTVAQIPEVIEYLRQQPAPYWVCISSEASWKNWFQLFSQQLDLLEACHYLVLGERLYQLLQDEKQRLNMNFRVSLVNQLKPEVILNTLEQLKRDI